MILCSPVKKMVAVVLKNNNRLSACVNKYLCINFTTYNILLQSFCVVSWSQLCLPRSFWPLNTNTSCVFSGLWHSSACLGHSDLLTPTLPVSFLDCDTARLHQSVPLWASLVLFVHCEAAPILRFVLTKSSRSAMPFFADHLNWLDINASRISQTVLTIFSCFLVTVQIHC